MLRTMTRIISGIARVEASLMDLAKAEIREISVTSTSTVERMTTARAR